MLSSRGAKLAAQLNIPWRFAQAQTYDPETNPSGLISFASAQNRLVDPEIEDLIRKRVRIPAQAFTYAYSTSGGTVLPDLLAKHMNEYFHPYQALTSKNIKITSAATALHEILAFSIAEPGEGILTSRPCYGRFELDFGNKAGLKIVYADTDAETCFEESVVDKFEKSLRDSERQGIKIRAILIVNPHNPLGICYPRSTLIAIMRLCQAYQIHLLSDEIYATSTFDSGEPNYAPFTSVLSIGPAVFIDKNLVHVIYGMSKDFAAAGLRIGALVSRNSALIDSYTAMCRFHGPSGASIAICIAMLEDGEWVKDFLAINRRKLAESYEFTTRKLREMGLEYVRGGNAGFFVYINLSRWLPRNEQMADEEKEFALAQKLVDEGVFLHPGEEHSKYPGWFRLVHTQQRNIVDVGLRRIKVALEKIV